MKNTVTSAVLAAALLTLPPAADARPAASWGLDRINQRSLPLDNDRAWAPSGRGVVVYVVDTGIYSAHTEFAGRVLPGHSVIDDGRGTEDCHGHGTHVAGTAAGATYGVAPGALIVPVRVAGCGGAAWASDVAAGVRWAVRHHPPGAPAVMNISFSTYPSVDLNRAVSEAVDDGIVVVVSAGNARDDACRYSPAAAPAAVTVGATEPSDARLAQSNFGPCVDIFAPGHFIFSAWNTGPSDARSLKGTSFAAPHVTGAAALLLEADPSLSPAQVAAALLSSATRGALTDVGTGSPNALLWVDPAPLPAPPTTTTVPPTTTTTVPPTVRISQAGRGYWRVEVTGAPPSATIGVRATNASRRPPEVVTWLVDTDSDGSAVFFVRKNLSRHTGQVVSH